MPQYSPLCTLKQILGKGSCQRGSWQDCVGLPSQTIPTHPITNLYIERPGRSQTARDIIFSSVKCQFALLYFDDIVNFSHSLDQHIDHMLQVLKLFNELEVTLKLKKCELFTNRIDYLGPVMKPRPLCKKMDVLHEQISDKDYKRVLACQTVLRVVVPYLSYMFT